MMLGALFAAPLFSGMGLLKVGFLAASTVGSMIMNGKKEPSGKLNDLKVSTSTYGRGISMAWGVVRVTGNMFWATDFEQSVKWVGGKKGSDKKKKGAQPVYVYHANFAMGLCVGPVSRVLRIWADGNLIYDPFNRRLMDDDYTDDDKVVGPGFSSQQQGGTKKDSMKGADDGGGSFNFRFYPGTETQLQDPFMVSKQGAGNVPAFRGMSYLFFEHFPLQDFGNRTPTITAEVEVYNHISSNAAGFHEYENKPLPAGYDWWNTVGDVVKDMNSEKIYVSASYRDPSFNLIGCLRVYDSVTRKEIEVVPFPSIKGTCPCSHLNDPSQVFKTVNGVARFDGITADGYLVFDLPEGTNASTIVWVTPGSYDPVYAWGVNSVWGDGESGIGHPYSVAPLSVVTTSTNGFGESITVLKSITLMGTMFGVVHAFDGFEHVSFEEFGGWYAMITPGYGTFAGGFFVTVGTTTSATDIYYVTFDSTLAAGKTHVFHHPDGIYGGIYGPFVLAGLDKIGIIQYRWFDLDPVNTGTFALVLDKNYNVEKEFKLSEDHNIFAWNTSGMRATPVVNPGFHCFYLGNAGYHRKVIINWMDGTFDFYDMTAAVAPDLWKGQYTDFNGTVYFAGTHQNNGMHIYEMWQSSEITKRQTVADIVYDMSIMVGLTDEQIDTSLLKTSEVSGYLLENPVSARQAVEDLSKIYLFDVVESDNKLKFISRGRDSMLTIVQDELAVVGEDDEKSYYVEKHNQEIDLPSFAAVSFINAAKKYETNTQFWKRPHSPMAVLQSREKLDINLPITMTPDDAIKVAQNVIYSAWSERIQHQFKLDWTHILLDTADVVTFQMDDGLTFIDRILKQDIGADYSLELETLSQDGATYNSTISVPYSPSGINTDPVYPHPIVDVDAFDIPFLSDTEVITDGSFFYRLAAMPRSRGFRYAGFADDESGTWDEVDDTYYPTIWGYVTGLSTPPYGPFVTDDKTQIKFSPGFDIDAEGNYEFASIPDENWPSDKNAIIIGGEIIYFKEVVKNDNGSYTLSTLIRGARGTEGWCYTHGAGERGIIVTTALKTERETFGSIGKAVKFRAYSAASTQALAPIDTLTFNANTHRPWAPVNFHRTNNANGSIRLSWCYRTRYGGQMKDGTDVIPTNEESLKFEVYILPAAYTTSFDPQDAAQYLYKVTVTNSTYIDLSAAQVTSFGIDQMAHIVVYQISATVGRGFAGYADLPRLLGS